MSALDFLAPGSRVAAGRSPMEPLQRAAGARFEQRGGWNLAIAFPGDEHRWIAETVGFADRSHLRKLEVHGPADGRWHQITPTRALAIEPPEPIPGALDVTCGLAALGLIGPAWHELLARLCAIDVRERSFPVGAFKPGSIARTAGYLLREADDRVLLMFGWALGEYMYEVVADAADHLGGGPVGADALEGADA